MPVVKRQARIETKFVQASPLELAPIQKKSDIRIFKIKCRYYTDKIRVNDVMSMQYVALRFNNKK